MTNPVISVIRREYLQRVRSRWFLFTTLGLPVLMLALVMVPVLMGERDARRERHLAIVDETGLLFDIVAPRLASAGYTLDTLTHGVAPRDLNVRVVDGDLGGYLWLDQETLSIGRARFVVNESPSPIRRFTVGQIVARSALDARLAGTDAAADLAALLEESELDVQTLGGDGIDDDMPAFLRAFTGTFFLYFVIFFYGIAVLRSVLEEKTGRIVEVIVSSMKPWQLMLGKILGVGAVGLTQLGVWLGSAAVMMLLAAPSAAAFLPEGTSLSDLQELLPDLRLLVVFASLFLAGYFLYAGLFAAVGAVCSTEEEAQQAQFPVMMLLVAPFVMVTAAIQSPHAPLWVGLSLVPFFSPILMYARAAAGAAATWEIVLSLVLMTLTILAVAWVAGRIYKVGILMQGKRPTLPELVRWVREA
jgi:ABC-2 type transport system permease protein